MTAQQDGAMVIAQDFFYRPQAFAPRDIEGKAPRFAVVMRTRNRPLLLPRALSSVALQKYRDWRLYLVNDGGDRAEVDRLVAEFGPVLKDRLTVIHHERSKGMEAASNAALARMSDEDFVVVHDDDDAWHPDFMSETAAFLSHPDHASFIAVCTGSTLVIERIEHGEVAEVRREPWSYLRGVPDLQDLIVGNNFPPICLVIRRAALTAIGGFNPHLPVLGDWDANLRLSLLGDIGFIDRALAYYHHRQSGTNSTYSNTVVDGVSSHQSQNVRLRNAMVRRVLRNNPEMLGLLAPLMRGHHLTGSRLDQLQGHLDWRFWHHQQGLEATLHQIEARLTAPRTSAFGWLGAWLELELAKLLNTLGQKEIAASAYNHARAALAGEDARAPSLFQWIGWRLKLEVAKLYCSLGQKDVGVPMWNDACRRLGRPGQ